MLDFGSIVAFFELGWQTCGWATCMTTFATNFTSWSAVNVNISIFGCRFYKSIIRVNWISRQTHSIRENPGTRLIMVLRQ